MTLARGRHLPDAKQGWFPIEMDDIQEGDYWKVLDLAGEPMKSDQPGNLTGTVWMFKGPSGSGFGTLMRHTVREHEDGTISVLPGDGSSNSILQGGGGKPQWHGYIYNGEWREC